MEDSRYILLDGHGTPFDVFTDESAALAAWNRLVDDDPEAADDCFVAVFDKAGNRTRTLEAAGGQLQFAASTTARGHDSAS